jgi:CheY-like chemotaxis protein
VLLVALTSWSRESDRERSLAAGFDRHMVKPVQLAALTSLLADREQTGEPTAP